MAGVKYRIPPLGAAVAFYTLLSLAPLLIIVVAIAGAVSSDAKPQPDSSYGRSKTSSDMPEPRTRQTVLKTTQRPGAGVLATVLGSLALFIGATTAVPNFATRSIPSGACREKSCRA